MRKKSDLHGYQDRAITYLFENDRSFGLLPVGAGKTVIGWTAATELMDDGVVDAVLVIAPIRVAQLVWPFETEEWEHLKGRPVVQWGGKPADWDPSPWRESRILWGQIAHAKSRAKTSTNPKDRRVYEEKLRQLEPVYASLNRSIRKTAVQKGALYVTSYENLMWLCDLYPKGSSPFGLWIFDEIGKLKNPKSPRYKEVRKHTPSVPMVCGLNATPAPEGFEDLFAQVNVIDGGKLWGKSFYKWREKFFRPADYQGYKWKLQLGARAHLLADLETIAFKVDESELSYQKQMTHTRIPVELPAKARELYIDMEKKMLVDIEQANGEDRSILALSKAAAAMKVRQIVQGFIYDEHGEAHILHTEKADALSDLIDSMGREPLLVAYEFTEDLRAIQRVWKNVPYLGQGISASKAEDHVRRWNAREIPVLAMHPLSAGHGLNLQKGGSHISWYAIPWPLESYLQANGRIGRQGQTRACYGHHIVAKRTVDERISMSLTEKSIEQDDIVRAIRNV